MLRRLATHIALLAAAAPPCLAQSPPPAPLAQSASSSAPQPSKKDAKPPKKVWTNEDLAGLAPGGVSVVGEGRPQKPANPEAKSGQKPAEPTAQLAVLYRRQLVQLYAELEQVDKKLGELRSFNASNASAAGGLSMRIYAYSATSVSDQITQLEAKRKEIQARIEALEDDARHKGIPPGKLR